MRRAPPFLVLGNPGHRRVALFQEALAAEGLPPAHVLAWEDLVASAAPLERVPDRTAIVRIDSPGQSFEVDKAMLARGFEDAEREGVTLVPPGKIATIRPDFGRILAPRQHHLGFLRVLDDIGRALSSKPRLRALSPPASIAELFDKRATSRRYASLGIPVPRPLDGVGGLEALRARLAEAGARSAYVKLASGSSASCLALVETDGPAVSVLTTMHRERGAFYNTRSPRRVTDAAGIDEVLGFLLREGSQVEEAVEKARLDGAVFDCRVIVVAGEPAFTVVRQSRSHPITNLHLGGFRGDLGALRAEAPAPVWEAAMESCRRVHAAHGCLHVGVDVLFEAGFTGHRVIEANAFGDLFPGLERDGLSVHRWEIREILRAL